MRRGPAANGVLVASLAESGISVTFSDGSPREPVASQAELPNLDLPSTLTNEQCVDLGRCLAQTLLPPEIREALSEFLDRSIQAGAEATLSLDLRGAPLQRLPWEMLYLEEPGHLPGFVSLWPKLGLRRGSGRVPGHEGHIEPLRVLIAYADPASREFGHLAHLDEEVLVLAERLNRERPNVIAERLPNAGPATLRNALLRQRPHVLHFVGHARRSASGGELVLQGGRGEERLSSAELGEWLREAGVELAFLSACDSAGGANAVADNLVRLGVPAAIGMQAPIADEMQRALVDDFYREILRGRTLEESLAWARSSRRFSAGWWAPVLVSNTVDCRLRTPPPSAEEERMPPNNLPAYADRFVGRRPEVDAMLSGVFGADRRLLVLSGLGGVGKTRLALEFAARCGNRFPDGVWLVEGDGLGNGERLLSAIAAATGAGVSPADGAAGLARALGDRRILLILDALETLLAEGVAEQIEALVEGAPGLVCVVTSRLGMSLPSALEVEVGPLPVDEAGEGGSAELFLYHATQADRTFRPTPEQAGAVAEVCRMAGGIPLALQLAAARVAYLSLEELLEMLQSDLESAIGAEDAFGHRSSLSEILEGTIRLLPEVEVRLLRRLCVFSGGFALRDASEILNIEMRKILQAVVRLRSHSVLHSTKLGQTVRYRILDPVREHLTALLGDDADVAQQREDRRSHARFYAASVAPFRDDFRGMDEESTRWLWREIANVRGAVGFSLESGLDFETGAFAAALAVPFLEAGLWSDLSALATAGMAAAQRTGDLGVQIRILGVWGALASRRGEKDECLRLWRLRLRKCREASDLRGEADTLIDLAVEEFLRGDYDESENLATQALPPAEQAARPELVATVQIIRGRIAVERGDLEAARAFAEAAEATSAAQPASDPIMFVHTNIGRVFLACGDPARARDAYLQALDCALRANRRFHILGTLVGLADVWLTQEEYEQAARCLLGADKLSRLIRSRHESKIRTGLSTCRTALSSRAGSAIFTELQQMTWEEIANQCLRLLVSL